jgi:predicted MFS family arabinose efflux permease
MAATAIAVIVPLALFVIKDGPEVLGLEPDGGPGDANDPPIATPDNDVDSQAWTLGTAMRTVAFWGLSACFSLVMMAQGAFLVHQVMFLQSGLGLLGAASIVTVTTIMGMAGRAGFLLIGDRLTVRWWATAMFAIQALSFAILALGETPFWLTVGSALFGLTMGIVVILQPLATAAVFGQESFGRVYGGVYMSIRIGAGIGPLVAGLLVVAAGGYKNVWLLMAGALLAGMACIPWAMAKPKR